MAEYRFTKVFDVNGHLVIAPNIEDAIKVFKEYDANAKICLNVIHAVQEEGLRKVCEEFDEVTVTNSYDDWEKLDIPNLKVIDIVNIKDPLLNLPV